MFGPRIKSIDAGELARLLAANPKPRLIDVREPDEFAAGHVPGAINVPLATVSARAREFAPDEPLLVICRSGRRSQTAAKQLAKLGFSDVHNIRGGTLAWQGPLDK